MYNMYTFSAKIAKCLNSMLCVACQRTPPLRWLGGGKGQQILARQQKVIASTCSFRIGAVLSRLLHIGSLTSVKQRRERYSRTENTCAQLLPIKSHQCSLLTAMLHVQGAGDGSTEITSSQLCLIRESNTELKLLPYVCLCKLGLKGTKPLCFVADTIAADLTLFSISLGLVGLLRIIL